MYENVTHEVLLGRMLSRVPDKFDKRPSSLIYDTQSAAAVELENLYIELEYLIKNSYGDTAAREYLILLCRERGIEPKKATNAVLKGIFTPDNINLAGKRFNIGEINYTVMEEIEPGQYMVECETPGAAGNRQFGTMSPIEYINGLHTAELTEVLIPGEDEEETEELRKRYFDSFSEHAFGGNRADYLEKAMMVEGVGSVKVKRVWNGDIRPSDMIPAERVKTWYSGIINTLDGEVKTWLSAVYRAACEKKLATGGTILISIVDSDDYGPASDALVRKVQEIFDPEQNAGEGYGLAPIGHVVNVKSAEPAEIRITTDILFEDGYNWDNRKERIENEVRSYLLELRKNWADYESITVRISHIESRILSIEGIADITDTKINDTADNLKLAEYEVPVFGGVSQ